MKENFRSDNQVMFCLPSSDALKGTTFAPIPLPKLSPYDIQQNSIPLPSLRPILNHPMTQPTSPRYHRSPSPQRYKSILPISIENYNPRKKQSFTDEPTVIAISILQINQSDLFIDPQQPYSEQMQKITALQNQIRQIRNAILNKSDESRERIVNFYHSTTANQQNQPESTETKSSVRMDKEIYRTSYMSNRKSRIEAIKEKNKASMRRAEEVAQRQKEDQLKRQNLFEQADSAYKRKLIDMKLKKSYRSKSNLSDINIVRI